VHQHAWLCFLFISLALLGFWTQGLVLYHLSHAPSPVLLLLYLG
jgi:hypothetical protein